MMIKKTKGNSLIMNQREMKQIGKNGDTISLAEEMARRQFCQLVKNERQRSNDQKKPHIRIRVIFICDFHTVAYCREL